MFMAEKNSLKRGTGNGGAYKPPSTRDENPGRDKRFNIRPDDKVKSFEQYATNSSILMLEDDLIEQVINPFFAGAFDDFYGSIIKMNEQGKLYLVLYFDSIPQNERHQDGTYALKEIRANSTSDEDLNALIARYNDMARRQNTAFVMTDKTKEILAEFVTGWKDTDKYLPDYYSLTNPIAREIMEPEEISSSRRGRILTQVTNISIEAVLKNRFGRKYDYLCIIYKSIPKYSMPNNGVWAPSYGNLSVPQSPADLNKHLLCITRADFRKAAEIAEKCFPVSITGSGIKRARR